MRQCPDCKIILDDDVRHCPKCGRGLGANTPSTGHDISTLLTSANLHRIRSEWDKAIADATEALRLDPKNPDITSLIAGVYEERGMLDEALVWYQMALELKPDSDADKARMDAISAKIAAKRKAAGTDSFRVFEKRTKLWAAVLGSVFVIVVVLAMFSLFPHHKQAHPVRPIHPSSAHSSVNVYAMKSGSSEQAAPHLGMSDSGKSTSTASESGGSLRIPAEVYIRSEIANAQDVSETGASVDDVVVDPRIADVIVTFSVPIKGNITKDQILRAAVAISRKTFQINPEVKFVTARCVITTGGPKGVQIAFIGDIARVTLESLPANTTDQQAATYFTRVFWNPQIR